MNRSVFHISCTKSTRSRAVRRLAIASPRVSAAVLGSVGLVAALAGCAGSGGTSTEAGITVQELKLASPALDAKHALPGVYACRSRLGMLPLVWGAVPAKATSLAIVVFNLTDIHPTPQGTFRAKITPQSAVAGLNPKLHSTERNKLLKTAFTGRHQFSVCPAKGETGSYLVRLYALNRPVSVKGGFDEKAFVKAITPTALGVGSLAFHYRRT